MSALALFPHLAAAQASDVQDKDAVIEELRSQLRAQEERLSRLERLLGETTATSVEGASADNDPQPVRLAAAGPGTPNEKSEKASPLQINGDARLRYEYNNRADGERDGSRGALRARLGAKYALSPNLKVGARIVTGNPDDPNSADVSLSNFNDDLQLSLDRLYGQATFGKLTVFGGKFENPFRRTGLVWDGDVNPQGLAAKYTAIDTGQTRLAGSALLFPIERSVGGPDSKAFGTQVTLDQALAPDWMAGIAAGYYDYEIEAMETADSGDIRTNLLDPSGAYLSDFDLIDIIAHLTYAGLGPDWPLEFQAEYVENLGADAYDTGYLFSASIGQAADAGSFGADYSFLTAEADAVFAAFAQDNIPYASNHIQHALGMTYALTNNLDLGANLYMFRLKDAAVGGLPKADWHQRLRINLVASF